MLVSLAGAMSTAELGLSLAEMIRQDKVLEAATQTLIAQIREKTGNPFFFVLNPALVLQGASPYLEGLGLMGLAAFGTLFICGGIQGYQAFVGDLRKTGAMEWPIRVSLVIGGFVLATPGGGINVLSQVQVTSLGAAILVPTLLLAGAQHAHSIIVATNSDPTAVLVTLTARELAPKAKIIASVREAENQHLLRQSGADSVVVSSETAGRLLGIATSTPSVVEMIEDLLTPDAGFAIAEREVETKEVGGSPRHLTDIVLGVVRDGKLMRVDAPEVDALESTDRLLYVRSVAAD